MHIRSNSGRASFDNSMDSMFSVSINKKMLQLCLFKVYHKVLLGEKEAKIPVHIENKSVFRSYLELHNEIQQL